MLLLLVVAFASVAAAQTPYHPALTGTVSSQADGPMEGVLVGAKRAGSTISTWVVSNAQGQYSFPRDRMEPGHYAVSIRAVGYELPATSVDLRRTRAARSAADEDHAPEAGAADDQRRADHERAGNAGRRKRRSAAA